MKEYIFSRPDEADDTVKRDAYYRGELTRCKDCKHRPHKDKYDHIVPPRVQTGVYDGEPEYDDDMTCPYICDDCWYSRIPDDEQYCDKSERKENDI